MYVVLGTNTNHDETVYGPFSSEKKAQDAKHSLGVADQLHEYRVLKVEKV